MAIYIPVSRISEKHGCIRPLFRSERAKLPRLFCIATESKIAPAALYFDSYWNMAFILLILSHSVCLFFCSHHGRLATRPERTTLILSVLLASLPASLLLPTPASAQATFTVNSPGDAVDSLVGNGICDTGAKISGGAAECTFRAAIQEANADALKDNIFFGIPGLGAQSISPGSPLPDVTQPVIIDASTQTGYSNAPVVELEGSSAVQKFMGWLCLQAALPSRHSP